MALQRCEQGHYYDASINRRCPDCGIPGLDVTPTRPVAVPPPLPVDAGVRAANAGPTRPSDGLTRSVRDMPAGGASEGRTIAWWDKAKTGTNPVVGWLVAIDGPCKGRDFRVYSEGNSIGRDIDNKIVIQDETVSRNKHAILYYDPRSEDAAYHIQAGDGPMTYLNSQAVMQPTRLKAYDILSLGKTKLLFVPLCNQDFRWTVDEEASTPNAHA
jgi:hypothetical protein